MTNHPVHVLDEDGNLSPTALIPFCEFGEDISAMGVKIDKLDVPVCNSFKAVVYNDQLCYTVDPNKYRNGMVNGNSAEEEDLSLALYINYNEDREEYFSEDLDENNGKFLYIGTLGSELYCLFLLIIILVTL